MEWWGKTKGMGVLGFVCALWLVACDPVGDCLLCGDGGGRRGTSTGVFKDSNVSGLSYVSGLQSGVTGPDGSFTFELINGVPEPVTFSVGGVTIGTAPGGLIVTPIDLIDVGGTDSIRLQNIVRFLLMLDDDGDPGNGINISPAVRGIAETFEQVDFDTADLPAELESIITEASEADGVTHVLPDAATAKAHLESTLRCIYSGAFSGRFSGDDRGRFGFVADATTGFVNGFAFSRTSKEVIELSGMTPINFEQNAAFFSGSSMGPTFSGQLNSGFRSNAGFIHAVFISGTWENVLSGNSGKFEGSRIGGAGDAADAAFKFTASYTGDDAGVFAFDIDDSDNITGVSYSVNANEEQSLSGSLSGTSLSIMVADGAVITGTLDKTTGALSGTWMNDAQGLFGTYTGSGCKLN